MNPEAGFLEAIRAEPRDDTHRLIYADWLEERGDPRGELIHLQCRLADLPEQDERRHDLLDREAQLLRDHGPDWLADLPNIPGIEWQWDRGFPWAARAASLEAFREHAPAVFRTVPLQKLSVRLAGFLDLQSLVEIPGLERLTALDLTYGGIQAAGAQLLAQVGIFRNLQALRLGSNGIGSTGLQHLAGSPNLAGLTTLDVASNSIDLAGSIALAESPHLTRLTRLNLDTNNLGDSLHFLVGSPHAHRWRVLNLSYNNIGDFGAEELARTASLANLTALFLRGNDIGDRGATDLATAPHFAGLQTLNLSHNQIGDRGGRALAWSSTLSRLSSLYLWRNPISPSVQQSLLDHFGSRVDFSRY